MAIIEADIVSCRNRHEDNFERRTQALYYAGRAYHGHAHVIVLRKLISPEELSNPSIVCVHSALWVDSQMLTSVECSKHLVAEHRHSILCMLWILLQKTSF
jgi:hypothetical protein